MHDLLITAWAAIRAGLRSDIGARTFDHWLKPVELVGYCDVDHAVQLALPSEFMASWVSSHYADRLTHAWRAMLPQVRSIRIETLNGKAIQRYTVEETVAAEAAADVPVSATSSQFDRRLTFDNFVTGAANQVARNAARGAGRSRSTGFNPLYLHSQTGQGKTHLLHAIGHACSAAIPMRACSICRLNVHVRFCHRDARARYACVQGAACASADVLMIDDVQFIAGKNRRRKNFCTPLMN